MTIQDLTRAVKKAQSATKAVHSIPTALAAFDDLPNSAHVRLPVLCGWRGISPATAWRYCKAGLLPMPKKLGKNVTAWNVGELRAMDSAKGGA
jgi:predicted DNA-binding transcriptional regulator AlpA